MIRVSQKRAHKKYAIRVDFGGLKVDLVETLGDRDDIFGVESLVDWGGFEVGMGGIFMVYGVEIRGGLSWLDC